METEEKIIAEKEQSIINSINKIKDYEKLKFIEDLIKICMDYYS